MPNVIRYAPPGGLVGIEGNFNQYEYAKLSADVSGTTFFQNKSLKVSWVADDTQDSNSTLAAIGDKGYISGIVVLNARCWVNFFDPLSTSDGGSNTMTGTLFSFTNGTINDVEMIVSSDAESVTININGTFSQTITSVNSGWVIRSYQYAYDTDGGYYLGRSPEWTQEQRFLHHKIIEAWFNGEHFPIDEGSGTTITGDSSTVLTMFSNATASDMWFDDSVSVPFIRKDNFILGVNDIGYGGTTTTDFWQGIDPPTGGYTIYKKRPSSTDPSIFTMDGDTELIDFLNDSWGASVSTISDALVWGFSEDDVFIVDQKYPDIVTDGMIFNFDAGFCSSYPRGGTNSIDISDNNLQGVLTNGPTYGASGSIIFDGDNDFIDYGSIDSDNPLSLYGLTDFSVDIWVKASGVGDTFQRLIDKSSSGSMTNGWGVMIGGSSANTDTITMYINGTGVYTKAGGGVTDFGNWRHYTFVRSGSVTDLYVNGSFHDTQTASKTIPITTTNCRIGSWNHATARELNGEIGSIKVYNRSLTSTEVTQNYDAISPRYI